MTKNTDKANYDYETNAKARACDAKKPTVNATIDYGFYSNVLHKPFENLVELKRAEEVYFAEQKAKEDKAAQKKTDAKKVDDAFKALNAARKTYKEELTQLTTEYAEALDNLKKAFELGKKDIHDTLAAAEDTYAKALKEFTEKHPEGYHLTLKDSDFETTISKQVSNVKPSADFDTLAELFNAMFNF